MVPLKFRGYPLTSLRGPRAKISDFGWGRSANCFVNAPSAMRSRTRKYAPFCERGFFAHFIQILMSAVCVLEWGAVFPVCGAQLCQHPSFGSLRGQLGTGLFCLIFGQIKPVPNCLIFGQNKPVPNCPKKKRGASAPRSSCCRLLPISAERRRRRRRLRRVRCRPLSRWWWR